MIHEFMNEKIERQFSLIKKKNEGNSAVKCKNVYVMLNIIFNIILMFIDFLFFPGRWQKKESKSKQEGVVGRKCR